MYISTLTMQRVMSTATSIPGTNCTPVIIDALPKSIALLVAFFKHLPRAPPAPFAAIVTPKLMVVVIFSTMLMREVSQFEGCVALEALLSIFEASRSEPPFRRLEFAIGLTEIGKDVLRNEFGAIGSFLHLARLRRPRACFVYHCRRCARGYIKRSTQKPNDVHGAPCGKLAL